MEQQIALPDQKILGELAQLAAYFVRPLEFVHDDHLSMLPIHAAAIHRLNALASFRGPLNRAASQALGFSKLSLSQGFAARLHSEDDLKLAVTLLQSERPVILALARSCAAVQLFPQIRLCVLKSQRNSMEAILGTDEFIAAVREAPVFYPCLPERSASVQLGRYLDHDDGAAEQDADEAETRRESADIVHPIVWEGLGTLTAFIRRADTACATLFSMLFPKAPANSGPAIVAMTDAQVRELKILLNRRGLTW